MSKTEPIARTFTAGIVVARKAIPELASTAAIPSVHAAQPQTCSRRSRSRTGPIPDVRARRLAEGTRRFIP